MILMFLSIKVLIAPLIQWCWGSGELEIYRPPKGGHRKRLRTTGLTGRWWQMRAISKKNLSSNERVSEQKPLLCCLVCLSSPPTFHLISSNSASFFLHSGSSLQSLCDCNALYAAHIASMLFCPQVHLNKCTLIYICRGYYLW